MKQNNSNYLFPLLGILCATLGTGALLARVENDGTLLVWGLLLLLANVLFAAATVGGTKEQIVQVRNPGAARGEGEPDTVEKTLHRIPLYPMFLALFAGICVGLYTGSALDGLLTLFTWGGFGYPLAHCILRRYSFGFSLQIGLLSSVVCTSLAGVIHVLKVSPDHSFQLKLCFDIAVDAVENKLLPVVTMMKDVLAAQSSELDPGTALFVFFTENAPEVVTEFVTHNLLLMLPSLFALAVFAALCVIWWGSKEVLKRGTKLNVSFMGRLDGYVPGRGVMIAYFVSYFAFMMSSADSVFLIISQNVNQILYYVLVFAGYSLVLFIINSRVSSKPLRIVLAVVTALMAFDSCGSQVMLLAGLMSSGNLRNMLGGGTLK